MEKIFAALSEGLNSLTGPIELTLPLFDKDHVPRSARVNVTVDGNEYLIEVHRIPAEDELVKLAAKILHDPYSPQQIEAMEWAYSEFIKMSGKDVQPIMNVTSLHSIASAMDKTLYAMRIRAELQRIGHWPTSE
jgi:hypothetical protein